MPKKRPLNIIKLPATGSTLALDYERYLPDMCGLIHYEHLHRYMLAAKFAEGKTVLDVSCGEGYGTYILSQVAKSVIGVDISKETIAVAKVKYSQDNITFLESDAAAIPLDDNSVDVVVSFETIEHLKDHDAFFREVKRVLKEDGIAFISSPNKYVFSAINGMTNKFHITEITVDEFEVLINRWFKKVRIMKQQVFGASHLTGGVRSKRPVYFEKNEYSEILQYYEIENPLYSLAVVTDCKLPEIPNSFYLDTVNKHNGIHYYQMEASIYSNVIRDLNNQLTALNHEHEATLAQKDSELVKAGQEYETLLADRVHVLSQKDAELSRLHEEHEATLAQKDAEMAQARQEYHKTLTQKNADISYLQQTHETSVSEHNAVLAQKDEEINRSRQRLEMLLRHTVSPPYKSRLRKIAHRLNLQRWFSLCKNRSLLAASYMFDSDYYLAKNPDVKRAGVEPVKHYLIYGWRELRDPSPSFSTRQYLIDYSDVASAGVNPLLHYLRNGHLEGRVVSEVFSSVLQPEPRVKKELSTSESNTPSDVHTFNMAEIPVDPVPEEEVKTVRNSIFFNEEYYRNAYVDLAASDMDMARHYCEHGWREGRDPSVLFDTMYYLATNMDIYNAEINPLYHYIIAGRDEGRTPSRQHNCDYEDDCWFGNIDTDIKPIAFYLPQFHEIPENNEWWGEGFTEWTNTRKAKPLIEGHYQPREPHNDIGYYDLSDWQVLKHQTEMAKAHGIFGFCFYHYWFAGKRLLEKPVDMFLDHPEIDLPFCLCWANENWTRRWDGFDEDILIEQYHSAADDIAFIDEMTKYLEDDRYIRIDGKPVILLYRPAMLPDAKETADRWRKQLKIKGIGEVYLVCTHGVFADTTPPHEYGFDAGFEFPPNIHLPHQTYFQHVSNEGFEGNLCKYEQFVADVLHRRDELSKNKKFDMFYSVMLGWDNTARLGKAGTIFTYYSTSIYREWLDRTIEITRREHKEDRRFIFINAWNEWAEGTHLEPDKRYGYLSLNETSRALCNIKPGRKLPKVSVVVPNYNHAKYLIRRLDSIYNQTYKNIEVILMDDCSSDNSLEILDEYAGRYPYITKRAYNETNSGGVFHQWAKGIRLATGELVWIAESDDFCDENFLDTLVQCFEDEAVLLAYSNCVFVDENETPLAEGGFEYYVGEIDSQKWQSSYVETAHNEVRSALGIINTIPNSSGVLFRRPHDLKLLDDEEWLSMSVAGDWVFYLHIIHGGKIAYDTRTSNYFRRYEGSAAESTYKKDVYYREVGIAGRTIASLYDVPMDILEQSRDYYLNFFESVIGDNEKKFYEWYNFEAVLKAQKKRRPAVMVSLLAFYPGGAEIIAIRLVNEFKRQGLAVLLHSGEGMPRDNRIRRMLRNDIPILETGRTDEMRNAIQEFGIEVLNSHHWHIQRYPVDDPTVFADLPRHVATLHGMIEGDGGYGVTPEQLRLVDKYVDTWVYTADKNVEPLQSAGLYDENASRFVKIPNGMEAPNIEPIPRGEMNIPDNAFVLCNISRAIPEKGWTETIEVVKKARELSGKDIRLILVGNGTVYDEYCREGIPDFVYMPGFDKRSVGYYATSDMGIMLTRFRSESFPLTVMDCMFAGKPYIASDIGDIRNMLTTDKGMAGAVFELDDWTIPVDDVARIIADFATDSDKYEQAKSRVPSAAERYHIDRVAKEYLHVFSQSKKVARQCSQAITKNSPPSLRQQAI